MTHRKEMRTGQGRQFCFRERGLRSRFGKAYQLKQWLKGGALARILRSLELRLLDCGAGAHMNDSRDLIRLIESRRPIPSRSYDQIPMHSNDLIRQAESVVSALSN